MGNIKRTFDKAFKKQAVDLYLNGDMSYQSVADKLEIDKNQVRRWVKYFEDEGILGLEEKRG
ncbi:transposase, partial [Peribacillus butanolivorans]